MNFILLVLADHMKFQTRDLVLVWHWLQIAQVINLFLAHLVCINFSLLQRDERENLVMLLQLLSFR